MKNALPTAEVNDNSSTNNPAFDSKLLDILACPLTKMPLEYDEDAQELLSHKAELAFPIRNGIPILLKEEARPLKEGK